MNQLARLRPDKFDDKIVNEQISLVKTKTKIIVSLKNYLH